MGSKDNFCAASVKSKEGLDEVCFQAALLNAVGQAIVAADEQGIITYWNNAAEELYGYLQKETLGRNIAEVFKSIIQECDSQVFSSIKSGESWTGDVIAKRRDGELLAIVLTNRPIIDKAGNVRGLIGISNNVSELKWMQEVLEEAIKSIVELNEKLRMVDSLTRHDLRNKLATVNGRIYLLKKQFGDNEQALSHLSEIELVSRQMLSIMEFEQFYMQIGSEELKNTDVEAYVNEAAALFSDLKGATLVNDCHGLTVLADSLLRQIFYNLIDNTLKYGERVNKIWVHYEEQKDHLKLIYEDDGAGIPDDIRSHLFSEGYGKGTGYGLYLIKQICNTYGWTIQETGKQGQGAQFTMAIPKTESKDKKSYQIQ